jgi:hypothetical protein
MTKTKVQEPKFYRVDDVMQMLEVKETKAYQIIKKLNDELEEMGKITVAGRVSTKYFDERMY